VIGVGLAVRILGKTRRIEYPVRRIQELRSFEDHLYDMFVAMILRGFAGKCVKVEDVHGVHGFSILPKIHSF
jgi:hypothetical protein